MCLKPNIFIFLLLSLLSFTSMAQEDSDSTDTTESTDTEVYSGKALMVYGDGFMYSVKAPKGWKGDTAVSNEFYANIIFYEIEQDPVLEKVVIQVYTFKKENESLKEDLNGDIMNYREEHKKLEEQDFSISHSGYKCYSKLVFVKDNFYQYLVYVDPGKKYQSGVSISMNTRNRKAKESELKALRKIVASLSMIKG